MAVGLRCTLPGKLHRVTGPLAHHVVLNHTLEHLVLINKWNYKTKEVQVNISTHEMYIHACCDKLRVTA